MRFSSRAPKCNLANESDWNVDDSKSLDKVRFSLVTAFTRSARGAQCEIHTYICDVTMLSSQQNIIVNFNLYLHSSCGVVKKIPFTYVHRRAWNEIETEKNPVFCILAYLVFRQENMQHTPLLLMQKSTHRLQRGNVNLLQYLCIFTIYSHKFY